ncbi:MAG: hypothetical protein ACI4WW_03725 [Candidatus Coprovivens sp.]
MPKKYLQDKKIIIIFFINILLIISNVFLIINYCSETKEELVINKIIFDKSKDYDASTIYYTKINYKQYKKIISQKKISTIAIIDNSSKTYNKFLEMINKISYYNNSNIYLFDTSKLSKKEQIEFFELDERLKDLNSDYIVQIKNNKIISVISYDTEELNNIVNYIERGE